MHQFDKHIPKYLLNSTSTFLAISNFQGKCLFINPCFQELLAEVNFTNANDLFTEIFNPVEIKEILVGLKNHPEQPQQINNISLKQIQDPTSQIHSNWELSIFSVEGINESFVLWLGHIMLMDRHKNFLQKASDENLKDEISKLKLLLNSTFESSVLLDPNFKILSFNKVAQNTAFEIHRKFLKEGDDFRPMILPENQESFSSDFFQALNGKSIVVESELSLEGQKVWYECAYFPAKNEEGKIIGVTFTTSSIDKRKKAEEKIVENEKFLESVLQSQNEMICRFRSDTTLTFVNDAYCRAFGTSRENIIGQKFLEFVPKKYHKTILNDLNQLHMNAPSQTKKHKVINGNNDIIWHEWTDTAIFDSKGFIKEFQAVGRDITELVQSRSKMERFQSIFENSLHEIYLISSNELRIIQANRSAIQNLGYEANTLCSYSFDEFISKPYRENIIAEIRSLLKSKEEKIIFESEHIRKSGSKYPIEVHLQKMNIGGELLLVAICVDLSERNQYIASITKQNNVLREIAWIQSHIVRAPLANILGLTQVLKEEVKDCKLEELVSMLDSSSKDLDKVIRSVASKTHIVEQLDKKIKN
ncbi:MAG: PAS domain S-box protein [Mongoliibacter sp.]|uniref:PAS domain S-box protein n=1 Tax=Mongoliibacter sp. TaxID=2022438 RepID=UPI0012F27C29|nr:PAS domain S-box protein [Mongoliibacter sp.]TVP50396.1 MAG: PAS domain S-box protein [Mongoliibacter sp.]